MGCELLVGGCGGCRAEGQVERSVNWLSQRVQGSEIRRAKNLFEKVPWGLRLYSFTGNDRESHVGHLAGLLSPTTDLEKDTSTLFLPT